MANGGRTSRIEQIGELLACLREHGVEEFKNESIEVKFSSRAHYKDPLIDNAEPDMIVAKDDSLTDEEVKFFSS